MTIRKLPGSGPDGGPGIVTPAKRARKAQERGLLRREQILDAARSTLLQRGLGGLVLRDLAHDLGITHGNLQYYFSSKDDLLVAVFDRELERYTSALRTAVTRSGKRRETVHAILEGAIEELGTDSTVLWRMLISLSAQNAPLGALLRQLNDRYDAALADELAHVVPEWSADRRLQIAQMIRLMLDGLSVQMSYDAIDSRSLISLQGKIKDAVSAWFEPWQGMSERESDR